MGVSWLGLFYGGNIAGAVFGCLFAGFYLLRVHDMRGRDVCRRVRSTSLWRLRVSRCGRERAYSPADEKTASVKPAGAWPVYTAIATLGALRAGRGGGLDAAARADARGDGVHVFDHPGGVSDRTGNRQQRGVGVDAQVETSAAGPGRMPVGAGVRGRMDGLRCVRNHSVMALQSARGDGSVAAVSVSIS